MSAPGVAVEHAERSDLGRVAWVTVSNPGRLNALDSSLLVSIEAEARALAADEGLGVVVLRGGGQRAFIGGADIRELAELDQDSAPRFIARVHAACQALRDLPVPVIAAIRGHCLGAGLELAAACDLRVATEGSQFGMPEVHLGVPSVVEAALLPGLVGWGRTHELVYGGRSFAAEEVLQWGLVERVVPVAQLDRAVGEWVESILRAGPRAIRLQKELLRTWERLPLDEAIEAGIDSFARAYATDEPRRRMRSFLDRRR